MKPTLHIITPCCRPQNLPILHQSVAPGRERLDIRWHIVMDAERVPDDLGPGRKPWLDGGWITVTAFRDKGSVAGKGQINSVLNTLTSGLIWVLDDDNLPAPGFFEAVAAMTKRALVVTSDFRHATPAIMYEGLIDQAQFVLDASLYESERYEMLYTADGRLAERVYQKHSDAFEFVDRPLALYNALNPIPAWRCHVGHLEHYWRRLRRRLVGR